MVTTIVSVASPINSTTVVWLDLTTEDTASLASQLNWQPFVTHRESLHKIIHYNILCSRLNKLERFRIPTFALVRQV